MDKKKKDFEEDFKTKKDTANQYAKAEFEEIKNANAAQFKNILSTKEKENADLRDQLEKELIIFDELIKQKEGQKNVAGDLAVKEFDAR